MPDVDVSPGLKLRAEALTIPSSFVILTTEDKSGLRRSAYRSAGLSLIELLVVLIIIAASLCVDHDVRFVCVEAAEPANLLEQYAYYRGSQRRIYSRSSRRHFFIDQTAFQQYFRFGIPTCPRSGVYNNLYNLTEQVSCSFHGKIPVSPSPTP